MESFDRHFYLVSLYSNSRKNGITRSFYERTTYAKFSLVCKSIIFIFLRARSASIASRLYSCIHWIFLIFQFCPYSKLTFWKLNSLRSRLRRSRFLIENFNLVSYFSLLFFLLRMMPSSPLIGRRSGTSSPNMDRIDVVKDNVIGELASRIGRPIPEFNKNKRGM